VDVATKVRESCEKLAELILSGKIDDARELAKELNKMMKELENQLVVVEQKSFDTLRQ
jgi:hypothetical protein